MKLYTSDPCNSGLSSQGRKWNKLPPEFRRKGTFYSYFEYFIPNNIRYATPCNSWFLGVLTVFSSVLIYCTVII